MGSWRTGSGRPTRRPSRSRFGTIALGTLALGLAWTGPAASAPYPLGPGPIAGRPLTAGFRQRPLRLQSAWFALPRAQRIALQGTAASTGTDLSSPAVQNVFFSQHFPQAAYKQQVLGTVLGEVDLLKAGFLVPSNSLVSSLLAQRSLDPTRFDTADPQLGAAVQQDAQLRAALAMSHSTLPLNGLLPMTPFFNYLRWRRSLDPARFDFYHPQIAPFLAQDQQIRSTLKPPSGTGSAPELITPPPSGGNGQPTGGGTGGGNPPPLSGGGGGNPPPSSGGGNPPPPSGGGVGGGGIPGGTSGGGPPGGGTSGDGPPGGGLPGGGNSGPGTGAVPEPSALALLLIGLGAAAPRLLRRRSLQG